jgi:hypothetical protein
VGGAVSSGGGGLFQGTPVDRLPCPRARSRLCETLGAVHVQRYQGYIAHKKQPPPQDRPRALGMFLLQGPRGALFLMREVPLYSTSPPRRRSFQKAYAYEPRTTLRAGWHLMFQ